MASPWMTSNTLIAAVKRKISFPAAQATFTDDDILAFANEEMMISQVPSVMLYHEEYYVQTLRTPVTQNVNRYAIPSRAIGMKLRDLMWSDSYGNLYEMTRVNAEDKAFFQRNDSTTQAIHKFYIENNDIVLTPVTIGSTGALNFYYFLRPNQLVVDERAAVMQSFSQTVTVDNAFIVAGNVLQIKNTSFTAKTSGAGSLEFNIGVTSVNTATNLVASINAAGIGVTANNVSGTSAVITLTFTDLSFGINVPNPLLFDQKVSSIISTNTSAMVIPSTLTINFTSIPDIFSAGSVIDFLETRPGHRIKGYDVVAQTVSGNTMSFNISDIPANLYNDDYVCIQNECIIPNLPPDLHNALAERTGARILAALGDQAGLQMSNAKIQEMNDRQGTILDNRVEGSPQKITARHSLLRYGKFGTRRRM